MTKFLRTDINKYKKLGRKKLRKWRRARGRHNKIREKKKGRRRKVEIGYKKAKTEGIIFIRNLKDTNKIKKGENIIIGHIGKRKRKEVEKKIMELGGKILNLIKENEPKK